MIKHPTAQETRAKVKHPDVFSVYTEAGLGTLSVPEKSDAQWVLRRKAKFSLAGYRNHNEYSPLTNTPLLVKEVAEVKDEPTPGA